MDREVSRWGCVKLGTAGKNFAWYSEWLLIPLSVNHTRINQSSFPKFQNNYTGEHSFCHVKINLFSIYVFFHAEFKYVIRIHLASIVLV
jgi:hypothetical protein